MSQSHSQKALLFQVFSEDYLVVCKECNREYRSEGSPSAWMDIIEQARRAKRECPACEICGQQFDAPSAEGGW